MIILKYVEDLRKGHMFREKKSPLDGSLGLQPGKGRWFQRLVEMSSIELGWSPISKDIFSSSSCIFKKEVMHVKNSCREIRILQIHEKEHRYPDYPVLFGGLKPRNYRYNRCSQAVTVESPKPVESQPEVKISGYSWAPMNRSYRSLNQVGGIHIPCLKDGVSDLHFFNSSV